MKISNKKLMSLLAGVALAAGVASPFAGTVYAAEQGQPPVMQAGERPQMNKGQRPPQFNKEAAAKGIAAAFGLDENEVKNGFASVKHPGEIFKAALLAKASDKSFAEVMKLKTADNSWQDVEKTLGVTPEKMRATRDDVSASQMETNLGIEKNKALALMKDGYRDGDIAMAGILAGEAKKSIDDVLAMKKINNTWRDVAKELGVSGEQLRNKMHFSGMPMQGGEPQGALADGPCFDQAPDGQAPDDMNR